MILFFLSVGQRPPGLSLGCYGPTYFATLEAYFAAGVTLFRQPVHSEQHYGQQTARAGCNAGSVYGE